MVVNQSTGYKIFLICAASILFVIGLLNGGKSLAAGGHNIGDNLHGDYDVDFDDVRRMSELWLLEGGGNEGIVNYSEVDLDELSMMNDFRLLAEDDNEPVISDVNLTPAGGHFELPDGLVIDVPVGAVSEATSFQIRLLDAEEVEPYLDIDQKEKSFMGGFEIISDGIVFNIPIWIQFPIIPLHDPNSLPHIYYLNKDDGTLIPALPEHEDADLQPQASYATLEATPAQSGYMYDPRNAIAEFMISITPPGQRSQMLNELYDVLGHSDCVANPCRCLRQFITSQSADLVSGDLCSKLSENGSIQFPDCEGQPTETWNMEHQSLQIAVKTDKNSILCDESVTMTVNIFDIDGQLIQDHEVKVTSSRPDLLEVTPFGGGLYSLERVGENAGVADVVIDAGCEITRTIHIEIGCRIPNVIGRWSIIGSERFWDCNDVGDNGVYPFSEHLDIDSQVGSTFAGSISYERIYELHEFGFDFRVLETYEERYHGEITPNNCQEITDRCAYKVSGSTDYTETFLYLDDPDNEPYEIEGFTTFSGSYNNGVMTLTSLGFDTKGDTCQNSGTVTLRR